MLGTSRGIIPAGKRLLPLILLMAASAPIAARADDGLVDVRTLPRLEGGVEEVARTEPHSLRYGVPTVVAITTDATKKLLAANGCVPYLRPLADTSAALTLNNAH